MTALDFEPSYHQRNLSSIQDMEAGVQTVASLVGGKLLCLYQNGETVSLTRAQLWQLMDWVTPIPIQHPQ